MLRSMSLGVEHRIAESDQRALCFLLTCKHAQRLEASYGRQDAYGITLQQPLSVTTSREIAQHRQRGFLRRKKMERQRRQSAGGAVGRGPMSVSESSFARVRRISKLKPKEAAQAVGILNAGRSTCEG
jgi:hypothetical protein